METPAVVYLAAEGYESVLAEELHRLGARVLWSRGRLFAVAGSVPPDAPRPCWAQDAWLSPRLFPIRSISHAARELKAMQRNWVLFPLACHRRAALIEAALPPVKQKPFCFGSPLPTAPLGGWCLLDANTLLASQERMSPFPHGKIVFAEDKDGPPSRAYLKLWEALTLLGRMPGKDDFCLDLGSSPGGWTWVLAHLGATVLSLDKAPLDNAVAAMPGVRYQARSAFSVAPREFAAVDWLCCDVICYPQRLVTMLRRWLEAENCRNFICTVKFQGDTDHATAESLRSIPGSRLVHLSHNKHELTWMLCRS